MILVLKKLIFSKYGVYALLLVSLTLGLYYLHYTEKTKAVNFARQEIISQYERALENQRETSRRSENEIFQSTINRINEKDEKIKDLSIERDNLVASLHERERRSNNSNVARDTKTCTGAELYREDAEFLARESARADRILEERNFWYSQYESVRQILDNLREQSNK